MRTAERLHCLIGTTPRPEVRTIDTAIALREVSVVQDGQTILDEVDWSVARGAHTVVLGPNGAGKTTVLRVVAGYRFATQGTVDVLGHRVGRVDMRDLRRHIGIVSEALDRFIDRRAPIRHLVAAAIHAVTHPTRRELDDASLERADAALELVAMAGLGDRAGTDLSQGEWQRALLARALVVDPDLLLLDEPCVGLDLAQREYFLAHLDEVLERAEAPTGIVVTHHLEEVPRAITHALLLRDGRVSSAGPVDEALTSATVSATYDLPVEVTRHGGRFRAAASHPPA